MNQHPKRFTDAVQALYDGFFTGVLIKGDCAACAVGNIISKAKGYTYQAENEWHQKYPSWNSIFCTMYGVQKKYPENLVNKSAMNEILATGYEWHELAKVEFAFERAPAGKDETETQYNGLMAVIPVLCEIEGIKESQFWSDFFQYDLIDEKPVAKMELTYS